MIQNVERMFMHEPYLYTILVFGGHNPPRFGDNVVGYEKNVAGFGRKVPPFEIVCLFICQITSGCPLGATTGAVSGVTDLEKNHIGNQQVKFYV